MDQKIHLSSKAWAKENDIRTAEGKPRKYRVIEAASNHGEMQLGCYLAHLLHDASKWKALHDGDINLKNRALASRLILRQLAVAKLCLVVPHETMPLATFSELLQNGAEGSARLRKEPPCMWDEWSAEHSEVYPDGEHSQGESLLVLEGMADEIQVSTLRSEMVMPIGNVEQDSDPECQG